MPEIEKLQKEYELYKKVRKTQKFGASFKAWANCFRKHPPKTWADLQYNKFLYC
jgi:hypothetical protein